LSARAWRKTYDNAIIERLLKFQSDATSERKGRKCNIEVYDLAGASRACSTAAAVGLPCAVAMKPTRHAAAGVTLPRRLSRPGF